MSNRNLFIEINIWREYFKFLSSREIVKESTFCYKFCRFYLDFLLIFGAENFKLQNFSLTMQKF